jgi:hypothetical protein
MPCIPIDLLQLNGSYLMVNEHANFHKVDNALIQYFVKAKIGYTLTYIKPSFCSRVIGL